MLLYKAFWTVVLLEAVSIPYWAIVQGQRLTPALKRDQQQKIIKKILTSYDSAITPLTTDDDGVRVSVDMYLRNVFEVDDQNHEMSIAMTFRQRWTDPRLNFSEREYQGISYVTIHDPTKIWTPDLFISNSKKENLHGYSRPNMYIRISPNGDVLLSERLSFTTACSMDLSNHPFDSQSCTIRIASYGYSTEDVIINWKEGDPLQLPKNMIIPHFSLDSTATERCDAKTNTGTYSCIVATLNFKRSSSHYFGQVFVPLTMFIIVSYLVFWLEPQNLMGRLAISLSTLYVAISQVSDLNSDLPKGPNKVLDTFTGVCLKFIFVTVLETVIVYNLTNKEKSEIRKRNQGRRAGDPETEVLELEDEQNGFQIRVSSFNWRNARDYLAAIPRTSRKIDFIFIVCYPLAFLVFTLVYFFFLVV